MVKQGNPNNSPNGVPYFNEQFMNMVNILSLFMDIYNQELNQKDLSNSEVAQETINAVLKLQEENRELNKKIISQNEEIILLLKGDKNHVKSEKDLR